MQLGWIDFSKKDRQKVLDVMNLLQEPGAVDELGIGIVRDAFANYFFPGTSTIQTRAKYFLIVPYVLKEAVDGRFGKDVNGILRSIDATEKECGVRLLKANPQENGIIGKRVLPRGWVARKPSDIYWNGIRTYGIFTNKDLSIKEYVSLSSQMKNKKCSTPTGNRGDDNIDVDGNDTDAGDIRGYHFWNLPIYQEHWEDNLDIDLTCKEAEFLKKQIVQSTEGSLLSFILKNHIALEEIEGQTGFLTLTEILSSQVSEDMRYMMQLACDFDYLVYMARVRYNILLSEGKSDTANEEWEWISKDCKKYADVDLHAIFDRLHLFYPDTFVFLSKLQDCFKEGRIEDADTCIRNREVHLKGVNRAKLVRPKEFYNPNEWTGGGWLDYRFLDARRIVNDIYAGEVSTHV